MREPSAGASLLKNWILRQKVIAWQSIKTTIPSNKMSTILRPTLMAQRVMAQAFLTSDSIKSDHKNKSRVNQCNRKTQF